MTGTTTAVLNLIINGLPSIFYQQILEKMFQLVLNLIINGLPSISKIIHFSIFFLNVLNLIINGLPSILRVSTWNLIPNPRFKPYYKWITFNI